MSAVGRHGRLRKLTFLSRGFRAVLNFPGVEAQVAARAREMAQRSEDATGVPYSVERMSKATSRVVYVARMEGWPEDGEPEEWTGEREGGWRQGSG